MGARVDPVSRYARSYRGLLRLYPGEFRARYGAEMVGLFADQLREAEASNRPFTSARLWARSVLDLLATAPRQHFEKESPVPQPAEISSAALGTTPRRTSDVVVRAVLGLLPAWVFLILVAVSPHLMDPILENPPGIVGLPLGILILAAALVVMASGLVVLRRASSVMSMILGFVGLTLPATVVVILAPALVLALQNG
jgi:hypothetical protein